MKKILKKLVATGIALTTMMIVNSSSIFAIAQAFEVAPPPVTEDLFRPFKYSSEKTSATPDTKENKDSTTTGDNIEKNAMDSKISIIQNIANRTTGSWQDILGSIIKFILAITGALALISFTYAGIMMVTARGAEEQIKKGKDMIFLSILALAIIAASYAIVLGISNLKF